MNLRRLMVVAGTLLMIVGCHLTSTYDNRPEPPDSNSLDPDDRFTLYVSNQSFALSPVDIMIEIDGKVVVRENFDVGNQHIWKSFTLSLTKGKHRLKASSTKGEAELLEEFEVNGEHWAVVDFWYKPEIVNGAIKTPKHFGFRISDRPFLFA